MKNHEHIRPFNWTISIGSVFLFIISFFGVIFYTSTAWSQSLSYYEIDQWAVSHTQKKQNHGLVVGIVHGDKVRIRGYGQISQAQEFGPDENTIFEIGSISGVFTTALMVVQSQAGKFHLEARIDDYLPSHINAPMFRPFSCQTVDPNQSIFRSGDEDRIEMICDFDPFAPSDCISFCDLASHSSGISNVPKGVYGWNPLRPMRKRNDPYKHFSRLELYESIADIDLSVRPGLYYSFSSSGMALLGNLVADISESTYEELLQDKLLSPLQLHSTAVNLSTEQKKRFAIGHDRKGDAVSHWHFNAMAPAEGIKSTGSDLSKFLQAHLNTDIATLDNAFAQTIQSRIEIRRRKNQRPTWGGYGWLISTLSEASNLPITWVSGGTKGFRSFVAFSKDTNIGIVILSNAASDIDDLGFNMLEELVDQVQKKAGPSTALRVEK